MLKIHLADGKLIEGSVFAVDPVSNAIVLKVGGTNSSSYTLINSNQIAQIDGDLTATAVPNIMALGINPRTIEKKEYDALEAAERSIAALNFDVNAKVQSLFDSLNKIWDRQDMVVLESYTISPPYDIVVVKDGVSAAGDVGLKRLEMMLEGERKKLGF